MLATLTRDRFFDADWIYERKFDGERCIAYSQAHSVALMTRNQKDVSATYPEVCAALAAQAATGFVVDGEVVALDRGATSFSRLQQRLGVRGRCRSSTSYSTSCEPTAATSASSRCPNASRC
jgi:bifunctional non-homologous end joining protein LigD